MRFFRRETSSPTTLKVFWAGEARDRDLLAKLQRQSDDLASVDGRHYTEHVESVKALRRAGDDRQAEALLLRLVAAAEAESQFGGHGVTPWYYEQLAIIYRKCKDPIAELQILERYEGQEHALGAVSGKLLDRLDVLRRSGAGSS